MARACVVLVVLITTAAGCRLPGENPPPPFPDMPQIQRHLSLTTPSGPGACADLERTIEDEAVITMRTQMAWWRRYPGYGMGGADAGMSGPGSSSTTNLQTPGVDEADVMKNDGTRLFTLSWNELNLLRTWPATQLQSRGRLVFNQVQREMLLVSPDRLVVFSGGPVTRATYVDVSDLANPHIVGEVDLPGTYMTARRVGTAIRVVLRGSITFPSEVRMYPVPTDAASYAALEAENAAKIRAKPLSFWLPPAVTRSAGQERQWPHACDRVSSSNAPVTLGMTTVATLRADDPGQVDRWTMLGDAATVYATETSLYLASPHWWWWSWEPGLLHATYVHRFDLSSGTAAHVASGVFDGLIPDSFALGDQDGYLRVATHVGEVGADGVFRRTNRVVVLAPSGRELVEVGRTPDFADGERLMSARFLGDRGFVVTFRQVDPLFTLDLSNPLDPRVLGELTVPGFSTYLHPVDDARLVSVGVADNRGPQVSLFDVSDFAHPQLASALPMAPSGYSQAQYEHRAFTWLPDQHLFAVPYDDWRWTSSNSERRVELKVYRVGAGLTEVGTMSLIDVIPDGWSWNPWYGSYRRAVLTDQDAYFVTEGAVRVARLSDLSTPLATVITRPSPGAGGGGDGGTPDAG